MCPRDTKMNIIPNELFVFIGLSLKKRRKMPSCGLKTETKETNNKHSQKTIFKYFEKKNQDGLINKDAVLF